MNPTDTLKQAAQALRDTKPELAAALEAMTNQEPSAWLHVLTRPGRRTEWASVRKDDLTNWPGDEKCERTDLPLYAAPIATPEHDAKVRDAALEEAARIAESPDASTRPWVKDSLWGNIARETSARIRSLKSTGADHAK